MEEIRDLEQNRNKYQYNKTQHSIDMKNPTLSKNNTFPKFGANMERNTNVKQNLFPENGGILGRTCKVSLVSLKRVGSAISFTPSRKSSVRSNSSKTSADSNKSQIRKNSGQFDGCTARVRKHSTQSRKMSASSNNNNNNPIIAEIYRELEKLQESEFTSSSEDEDDDNNNIVREDLERQKRVEMYVKDHSHLYSNNNTKKEFHNNNNSIKTSRKGLMTNTDSRLPNHQNVRRVQTIGSFNSLERKYTTIPETGSLPTSPKGFPPRIQRSSTLASDNTDDGYFSSHTQITSNRLTKLFLDNNTPGLPSNDAFHPVPKGKDRLMHPKNSINPKLFHYLQVPEEPASPAQFYRNQISRGSVSSINSTISNSDSVPMNFIPGQTKPKPRQDRSNSLSLSNFREKAKFCFKGITCQVDRSTPKTYKAMAHAGMLSISIIGPSEHKCSH